MKGGREPRAACFFFFWYKVENQQLTAIDKVTQVFAHYVVFGFSQLQGRKEGKPVEGKPFQTDSVGQLGLRKSRLLFRRTCEAMPSHISSTEWS